MNRTNRTTAWAATISMAVAGGLLYATFAVAADDGNTNPCQDAWEDAPAYSYCTTDRVEISYAGGGASSCHVNVSSCSITVNVDSVSTTFTPSFPTEYTSSGNGLQLGGTDDIDICFSVPVPSEGRVSAYVRSPCATGAVTAANAMSNGITTPST